MRRLRSAQPAVSVFDLMRGLEEGSGHRDKGARWFEVRCPVCRTLVQRSSPGRLDKGRGVRGVDQVEGEVDDGMRDAVLDQVKTPMKARVRTESIGLVTMRRVQPGEMRMVTNNVRGVARETEAVGVAL